MLMTWLPYKSRVQQGPRTDHIVDDLASEKAFKCFVRSVHALQSLLMQENVVEHDTYNQKAPGELEGIVEDEQAFLHACWAESVFLKYRCVS